MPYMDGMGDVSFLIFNAEMMKQLLQVSFVNCGDGPLVGPRKLRRNLQLLHGVRENGG